MCYFNQTGSPFTQRSFVFFFMISHFIVVSWHIHHATHPYLSFVSVWTKVEVGWNWHVQNWTWECCIPFIKNIYRLKVPFKYEKTCLRVTFVTSKFSYIYDVQHQRIISQSLFHFITIIIMTLQILTIYTVCNYMVPYFLPVFAITFFSFLNEAVLILQIGGL